MLKSTVIAAFAFGCSGMWAPANADGGSSEHKGARVDIVETAVSAGSFETLVAAAKAADLVDTLKSTGPFTLFAPTDEAFAQLPKGTIESLLADPGRLASILKYHVVPGRVAAADVVKLSTAKTALGQNLSIDTSDGVRVGNAQVLKTDIQASNGIIHVIDRVLIPSNDIIETASSAGSFNTLLAALRAAGLTDALRGDGPFTVFAPTDAAFAKLPKGTVEGLLQDIPTLTAILTYHVVPGKIAAGDVVKLTEADTLQGKAVKINASSGVRINSAQVVKADVFAANGVIHVIDEVLLPPAAGTAGTVPSPLELIQSAIDRGVPLFNNGQHAACTAVYEVAAMGLLASANESLDGDAKQTLRAALKSVQGSHDDRNNAWVMRRALDEAYQSAARLMR